MRSRKRCINLHSIKKISKLKRKTLKKFHLDLSRSFFFVISMKRDHFPLFTPLKKALSRHLTIFSYKVTCQEFQYSDIRHSIQFRVTHLSSRNVYPLPRIVSDNPWNRLRVLVAWLNLTKTEISAKVGFNNTAIYLGCCNPPCNPIKCDIIENIGNSLDFAICFLKGAKVSAETAETLRLDPASLEAKQSTTIKSSWSRSNTANSS